MNKNLNKLFSKRNSFISTILASCTLSLLYSNNVQAALFNFSATGVTDPGATVYDTGGEGGPYDISGRRFYFNAIIDSTDLPNPNFWYAISASIKFESFSDQTFYFDSPGGPILHSENERDLSYDSVYFGAADWNSFIYLPDGSVANENILEPYVVSALDGSQFNSWGGSANNGAFNIVFNSTYIEEATLNVESVPEPLTILGTATALGFGALFKKKKLSQAK